MKILKKDKNCSIIIPVYNGETTILETLNSLYNQSIPFEELIIINDCSTDHSMVLIYDFFKDKKNDFKIINHSECFGLAYSYNEGIKISKNDLIITLHDDIILEKDALKKLMEPFNYDSEVLASFPATEYPYQFWEKYNFWEKVFFARFVNKKCYNLDGKFNCFKKVALEKVKLFDEFSFRTAGEDGDMFFKLSKIGKIVKTESTIIHLHKVDQKFNYKDIIHKQAQISEAQGVLLRKGRIKSFVGFVKTFFREIIIIMLFIPYIRIIASLLIVFYSFFYTKLIYVKVFKDPRCLILPFFNILLLFISFFYVCEGFISGKQKI